MEISIFYSEMIKASKELKKAGFDGVIYLLQKLTTALEKSEKDNSRMKLAITDQNRIIEDQHREIKALREMLR